MRRRLFTFASFLSLLLFAATVVLWVRSRHLDETTQWVRQSVEWSIPAWNRRRVTVAWAGGIVAVDTATQSLTGSENAREIELFASSKEPRFEYVSQPLRTTRFRKIGLAKAALWHGFYVRSQPHYAYGFRYTLASPLWAVALLAALFPALSCLGWMFNDR